MSSVSQERRIVCYPPPLYCRMFAAYVEVHGITESQAASQAIKNMIDGLPAEVRAKVKAKEKKIFPKNTY